MSALVRRMRWIALVALLVGCGGAEPLGPGHQGLPTGNSQVRPADLSSSIETGALEALADAPWPSSGRATFDHPAALNAPSGALASANASTAYAATLTIFADATPNGTGSSGGGSSTFGTHAFITIKNSSTGSITIGLLPDIKPGKTVSLSTWGNKSEHIGLWYNLDEYFVAKYGAYKARVSASYLLSSSQLSTLSSFLKGNDSWSLTSNCATFAVGAWNKVVESKFRLSAGLPNSPKGLATSIKAISSGFQTGAAVPFDYVVYYANGTSTPKRSSEFK